MQHAIGDHALLADRRTAALVDPDGNVAWLPWPRIDSAPLLLSVLDERRGGVFSLRPARPDAHVVARRYRAGTLVLETVWEVGRARLHVDDALLLDGVPRLMRRARAEGAAIDVVARFRGGSDVAAGFTLTGGAGWSDEGDALVTRFAAGSSASFVQLQAGGVVPAADERAYQETLASWQRLSTPFRAPRLSQLASDALAESELRALLVTSACVLVGLRSAAGGIVAAPTTSLPQWPGTQRTWDYRYCWLRDGALAATALLRLGFAGEAHSLAAFLGEVAQRDEPPALVRVDGTAPPDEQTLNGLAGWAGSRPVRTGNAAATQLQIDIGGDLTQLARALADVDSLPESLAEACARLASWTSEHWQRPDHGVWEIRGDPRPYTHSRVMAWTALRDAAAMADRGSVAGDATAWRRVATAIHDRVLRTAGGALQLTEEGGGADAALACVPLVDFLPHRHPLVRTTLDLIERDLDRNGLLDRCLPEHEALPDPCGAFLFPTFWMASALEKIGASGARHFGAALASRSNLGLFGEVADPNTYAPLGNYPQVQSHASFVLAATER